MAANNNSAFNLRSILDKEKLNGANFIDWYRNLRIILRNEKREYVLEKPYPDDIPKGANVAARRAYEKYCNDSLEVSCLMLATMSSGLQKHYENADAQYDSGATWDVWELGEGWEIKCLKFLVCMQADWVSPHVIKVIGYIESLERLDSPLNADLAIDVIL